MNLRTLLAAAMSLLLALALATACAAPEPEVPAEAEPAADAAADADSKYSQSPSLDAMVASGELAPVEERLPINPLVVVPGVISEVNDLPELAIGEYGGVMRFAHPSPGWNPDIFIMLNENVLAAPGIGVTGIYGNVVEDYTFNEDYTVFTFHLREGLKWSDGAPVTTEDVRFAHEDVLLHEDYTPSVPNKFRSGGSPDGTVGVFDISDDYTFSITFDESYGGFLRELSIKGWQGYTDVFKPSHHLKPLHTGYGDADEIAAMIEDKGLDSPRALFTSVDCRNWDLTRPQCAGFPAMWPWINATETDELMKFERNPYYFKVDAAGNQLPYIDEVVSALVADTDTVNIKVFADEVDMLREDTALLKLPLYQEAKESGYINFAILDNHVDPVALYLNLTFEDDVWREVVGNLDFRRAVSLAINRPEIIESIYYTYASLPELIPSEYDPEAANALLDSIGLDQRDSEGFRIGPDGNTFVVPLEHADHAPDFQPMGELLASYLQDVGIKTTIKQIDPSLWGQRWNANEMQATMIWSVQPMWKNGTWTDYFPTPGWAGAWRTWMNTNGESGEEPPQAVKDLIDAGRGRVRVPPASAEDVELTRQLYQNHYDNIWFIQLVEKVGYVLVTDAAMRNVPIAGQAIAGNNSGEQMFYTSE